MALSVRHRCQGHICSSESLTVQQFVICGKQWLQEATYLLAGYVFTDS
jgi:hypothetical protein